MSYIPAKKPPSYIPKIIWRPAKGNGGEAKREIGEIRGTNPPEQFVVWHSPKPPEEAQAREFGLYIGDTSLSGYFFGWFDTAEEAKDFAAAHVARVDAGGDP